MWITPLSDRFVRMTMAAVVASLVQTRAVDAQEQGFTYEVVANFENSTRNGNTPAALLRR
jgi:hypothetical protein